MEARLQQILNKLVDIGRSYGAWQYGGDGSDGAKTVSLSENLSSGIYNYTSLTIDASQTLGISDSNKGFLILLVQGDVTLGASGKISAEGKGAAGAAGGTASAYIGGDGYQGGYPAGAVSTNAIATCLGGSAGGGGSGGDCPGSGGVGGDGGGAGDDGGNGGAWCGGSGLPGNNGSSGNITSAYKTMVLRMGNKDTLFESYGAGGGGYNGGNGGDGGGFVYIECNKLTLGTGATISANGQDGEDGEDGQDHGTNSAGAGGGGGVVLIK